jgi:GNAT superfamily N-acetyltransferase
MIDLPEDVYLLDVATNIPAKAQLVRLTRELASQEIDGKWWHLPVSKSVRRKDGDNHWNWRRIVGFSDRNGAGEALAVQSHEGEIEGAIVYRIDAKSQLQPGAGAIYVEYIAAAPRNRPWVVEPPIYQGIGTILLLAAVRHSYLLGLRGRVWLSSLPSEHTRNFYRNRGFEMLFKDADGIMGMELPEAAAAKWLMEKGFL